MANGNTTPAPISFVTKRSLPNVTYQAGVRNTIQIDRDGVLYALNIRVQATITNGGTGPTGPLYQTLARIIRRVEVVVDGQDTVVSISGAMLAARNTLDFGARPYGMDVAVSTANGGTTDMDIVLRVPFYQPRAVRPDDTSLDLRNVTQAILAVTWGDISDLFTTPGGTVAISTPVCTVEAEYLINAPQEQLYMVRALDEVIQPVSATNPQLASLMDRGPNIFYRSFIVAALDANVASNSILDAGTQKLIAGPTTYCNRIGENVRADQATALYMPVAERLTGTYPFYLPYHEQNTTLINTGALTADLYFNFGATIGSGTTQLIISRESMRPLRA